MSSMAEMLAASARQSAQAASAHTQNSSQKPLRQGQESAGAIPARLEEALDIEGEIPIQEVEVAGTAILKILKHSTDANHPSHSSNPTPVDTAGLLLGIDLSGTAEIVDSYPLPGGIQGALNAVGSGAETTEGKAPYAQNLLRHLREVALLDSPIGIYLTLHTPSLFNTLISEAFNPSSTISGTKESGSQNTAGLAPGSGFLVKGIVELMTAIERMGGNRSKGGNRAVLIVHDAARSASGDVSIKAYKLSDGLVKASEKQRFDTASLIEHGLAPSNLLQPLKFKTKNPALLNALFSELSTPAEGVEQSLRNPSKLALPETFIPLQNSTTTALPLSLSTTLSQLTNLSTEQSNLAYQLRQVIREKSKHEQAVQARQQENEQRKLQGLAPLPDLAEPLARKVQDPSRLDMMLCLGAVDNAAKSLAAEAGKGLVKAFASG